MPQRLLVALSAQCPGHRRQPAASGGQLFRRAGQRKNAAYHIQRAVETAVGEGKQHFKQCTHCGQWVCPEVCWNASAGLCEACAPDKLEELRAQQAQAAREQIRHKTRAQDYTKELDFLGRLALVQCPSCHLKLTAAQKFCAERGAKA